MKYEDAPDIRATLARIIDSLQMHHVDKYRLKCIRSHGSTSNAVARCYALGKIWQLALGTRAHYIIEVISHRFDKLEEEEKAKVLIHELLHIPKSFGGGFRGHDVACRRNVEQLYKTLKIDNRGDAGRFLKGRLL
ncbi:MAG TPA: putative metallopeptidase [Candidatus Nanoarchaeia archaeon]|nr:putative metallopeptidase [Candidatus Nanoarchaeia archaeon]